MVRSECFAIQSQGQHDEAASAAITLTYVKAMNVASGVTLGGPRRRLFMNVRARRDRLLPWYIGLAVVVLAVGYIGYEMFAGACPAPTAVELIVLLILPAVYLWLMYLTLTSQK